MTRRSEMHGPRATTSSSSTAAARITPLLPQSCPLPGTAASGTVFNQLAVVLDCEEAAARVQFWNPAGPLLQHLLSARAWLGLDRLCMRLALTIHRAGASDRVALC